MSGEDDLRAAVASALRQHMDRGSSGRLIADYGIDATDLAAAALDAIRLATPAEPARESDGVGLREDERAALGSIRIAQGDLDAYGATWRVAEVVEKLIAARVAEAGARALMDAADNGPSSTPTDEWRMWLRDRARGLGGAS